MYSQKNSFPVLLLFCSFSRCCIHCPVWPRFEDWWLRSQILVTMEPGGESSTAVPHICLHASQIFAPFKFHICLPANQIFVSFKSHICFLQIKYLRLLNPIFVSMQMKYFTSLKFHIDLPANQCPHALYQVWPLCYIDVLVFLTHPFASLRSPPGQTPPR